MKEKYIDIIEIAVCAYSPEHIREYACEVRRDGLTEHGFPRLTANIGMLLAHGRRGDLREIFLEMMELCCDEIPNPERHMAGNEFSVKELVLCILELEKNGTFDRELTGSWREKLARIDPLRVYASIAKPPYPRIGNWAAFGAASEQLRKYAGIGREDEFIDRQIRSQLPWFDENGMHRDANEPMVYDNVTRLQLTTALYFGYDGQYADELDQILQRADALTLRMQSVTGEIPFGGRSAQFLHNETAWAALCEYYATRAKRAGDLTAAGAFKSAAELALRSVSLWARPENMRHIKNYYPRESKYGCEGYGYFNKYMVTTGSWCILAYHFADDTILSADCPATTGGYVAETGDFFHKAFLNAGGYFVEVEKRAHLDFDASGIGRVHKAGVPSALCLSVPMTDTPKYVLDTQNPSPLSISFGAEENGETIYSYDKEYHLTEKAESPDAVRTVMTCALSETMTLTEACEVSAGGVELTLTGAGKICYLFPVFVFDGETETEVTVGQGTVAVTYRGHRCTFTTNGSVTDTGTVYANRNGHYRRFEAHGSDRLTLHIEME